jgi:hypothetical protein
MYEHRAGIDAMPALERETSTALRTDRPIELIHSESEFWKSRLRTLVGCSLLDCANRSGSFELLEHMRNMAICRSCRPLRSLARRKEGPPDGVRAVRQQ